MCVKNREPTSPPDKSQQGKTAGEATHKNRFQVSSSSSSNSVVGKVLFCFKLVGNYLSTSPTLSLESIEALAQRHVPLTTSWVTRSQSKDWNETYFLHFFIFFEKILCGLWWKTHVPSGLLKRRANNRVQTGWWCNSRWFFFLLPPTQPPTTSPIGVESSTGTTMRVNGFY